MKFSASVLSFIIATATTRDTTIRVTTAMAREVIDLAQISAHGAAEMPRNSFANSVYAK